MARRQGTRAPQGAAGARTFSRRRAAHHGLGSAGLRRVAHRPLGVHVLASATTAKLARSPPVDPRAKEPFGQHRNVHRDRFLHCGKFLFRLDGPLHRLPRYHRGYLLCLFPRDVRRLLRSSESRRAALLVLVDCILSSLLLLVHHFLAAFVCSPCTCLHCSRPCCAPPARGSPTTSEELLPPLAPCSSAFFPRSATTGRPCSTRDSSFSLPP